jgi:hypothetical protein
MGGSNSSQRTQEQITQQQIGISQEQNQLQRENYERMKTLQQPAIDKETALATGDAKTALAATMPVISKASAGYDAAKQSIFNTLAPGAGRDKALADLEVNKATGIAGAQAQLVQAAPDKLANIGSGLGSFSLQELGAAISSLGGASSSNAQTMQAQEQSKASTMGFLGSLAGAGGSIFAGKSDRRLKENIAIPTEDALEAIMGIEVVDFDYRGGEKRQIGVIAQQIEPYLPDAISFRPDGIMLVDYNRVAMTAVRALQELAKIVKSQAVEIEQLKQFQVVE